MRNLLLISNSTNAGEEYLGWPRHHIKNFLDHHGVRDILFVPYAGVNLDEHSLERSFDAYEARVQAIFHAMGFNLHSVHRASDPLKAVKEAGSVIVGGGNTFHLTKMMHELGLMQAIRVRIDEGMPFVGWSAGANVACPTMMTTNDMPISEPPSFRCLGAIPFQINPHYLDANPAGHGGETREQRLQEYLAVNRNMVVAGLREATLFRVEGDKIDLIGNRSLRVFQFGQQPVEIEPGADISFLLG